MDDYEGLLKNQKDLKDVGTFCSIRAFTVLSSQCMMGQNSSTISWLQRSPLCDHVVNLVRNLIFTNVMNVPHLIQKSFLTKDIIFRFNENRRVFN